MNHFKNHYYTVSDGSRHSFVVFVLQKEQLTLGSGRVGLRNIGNTVSVRQ